jgi:hypothetical protein
MIELPSGTLITYPQQQEDLKLSLLWEPVY